MLTHVRQFRRYRDIPGVEELGALGGIGNRLPESLASDTYLPSLPIHLNTSFVELPMYMKGLGERQDNLFNYLTPSWFSWFTLFYNGVECVYNLGENVGRSYK